jgi:Zn-dependent M28 family amino/carboxypeptidase
MKFLLRVASVVVLFSACGENDVVGQQVDIDVDRMLADVAALSADSMEGRAVGTEGNRMARRYIVARFETLGLEKLGDGYVTRFTFTDAGQRIGGTNIVGYVKGTEQPDRYIVISAHYDHLGNRRGSIYNGADDNASGTAAMMALAEYFTRVPPRHSVIFVAFDAEESNLQGAKAFVSRPPVQRRSIVLNVNLDMVSHSERELVVAGTYHYPFLKSYVDAVEEPAAVALVFGHDSPDLPADQDWTLSSDHGPFHEAGIPFLYFGVEDHADYHRPTDDFETINPPFYADAIRAILAVVQEVDANLAAAGSAR